MSNHWEKKKLQVNILYSSIVSCFIVWISIDFFLKQNLSYDLLLSSVSNAFIFLGFLLLLIHHYKNTRWLLGFYLILIMTTLTFIMFVINLHSFIKNQ